MISRKVDKYDASCNNVVILISAVLVDVDEASKKEIKDLLIAYDRSLLVADPRRCELKKFGGPGPRARHFNHKCPRSQHLWLKCLARAK